MFHVQIQEPASRSTTTKAFVFLAKFIITKYLKQKVDDNLSVWVDEHRPCGLSKTRDINMFGIMWSKGDDVTTPNGEVSYRPLSKSCFYCPNLITLALVTRGEEDIFSKSNDYEVMASVPPEMDYPIEPF